VVDHVEKMAWNAGVFHAISQVVLLKRWKRKLVDRWLPERFSGTLPALAFGLKTYGQAGGI